MANVTAGWRESRVSGADGRRFVAMRRIVENMGLSWGSQHSKLLEQREKFMCTDIGTHDTTGRMQSMLAMPQN
ncbi:hypothetical protein KL86PLE_130531 [uncultured Pleomorphomonas sp.]|uniref:Antirepressor protein ant N-terminal domain-containing protein n=1 Tax=uncultured Pleomorphomonas sp. TaxID=442121 RepID=A0A212KXI9_9HYPH|nr:phage antirepressor N-terminal domain-containing protein [uncultured Pleomorphomonas sp.]SCM70011.1 hypothetical protein KL86PLE_10004 [uncultured Pleomorphomonas sp.]SCM75130.1 hypothetical protein KL86PLE_130531 [uncultured Pleomorphomonas sp.]